MNKIISTSDRLFMAVCGPSRCGKTELIFQMLLSMTKSSLKLQLLDVMEILASFTLSITYSNRVNGQEQLI